MGDESLLDRLRALLTADLAAGDARPLRSYLAALGDGAEAQREDLACEYREIVLARWPRHGRAAAAASERSTRGEGGPPASPPLPAVPPEAGPATLAALLPLGVPLTEMGEIARGGMGAVLRVHDATLRRDLAMKVVLDGAAEGATPPAWLARFVDEAQIQAQLDHPGVVPIHHLGKSPSGRICFTMKLVKGRSLEEVAERVERGEEPANLTRAVQCLLRVCETVGYAHEKGVVHRDLKPANVMIGNFGEVYVMDWGVAKVLGAPDPHAATPRSVVMTGTPTPSGELDGADARETQEGLVLGTPAYMSPEQAKGLNDVVDARSDVYSLGAILYRLLAGRSPYDGTGEPRRAIDVVRMVIAGPPEPLARLVRGREELVAIADKAMSRTPGGRYPTAREMGDDLQRWIEGRVVHAYRRGAWAELRKWVQRNRGVAGSLVVLVLVVALASIRYTMLERDAGLAVQNERDLALEARDLARSEARRALGLQLAADAQMVVGRDPARAAALALEAEARAPGPKALGALYAALRDVTEVRTLTGHRSYVIQCRWSPDGRRAWTGGRAGYLICWDTATGAQLARANVGPPDDAEPVDSLVAFDVTADGRRLLAHTLGGQVRLFDEALAPVATLDTGGAAVTAAAFSPAGDRIATADASGAVRTWDASDGGAIRRGAGTGDVVHAGGAHHVAWSPDGTRLASGGADLRVRVTDAASGAEVFSIACADAGAPVPARFVPPQARWALGGRRLVVSAQAERERVYARGQRRVRLLDAKDGREVPIRAGGAVAVDCDAVLPGGTSFLVSLARSGGSAGGERLVSAEDGTARAVPWALPGNDVRRPVAFRADGLVFAAISEYAIEVRTVEGGTLLQRLVGHTYALSDLEFSPDGRRLLSAANDRTARIWDVAPPQVRRGVSLHANPVRRPGGMFLDAEARLAGVVWQGPGGTESAELIDTSTGDVVWRTDADGETFVVPSPDGRRMAVRRAGSVEVIDVLTRRTLAKWDAPDASEPQFDPAGRRIALRSRGLSPGEDGHHEYLFDVERGGAPLRLANPAPGDEGAMRGGGWSADGTLVAAAHGYSGPVVWDARTGAMVRHLLGHTGMVFDAAFSPDGTRLVSQAMDSSARVWDLTTGAQVARCMMIMRPGRVAFTRDGLSVIAVQQDAVRIYDAADGTLRALIPPGDVPFHSRVSVAPSGEFVTIDPTGAIRFWPLDPGAWLRGYLSRRLTDAERAEHGIPPDAGTAVR